MLIKPTPGSLVFGLAWVGLKSMPASFRENPKGYSDMDDVALGKAVSEATRRVKVKWRDGQLRMPGESAK
jgi:hypothetical protein